MPKVSISAVTPGSALSSNLFKSGKTLFRKGHILSQRDIRHIREAGFRQVTIEDDSFESPRKSGTISNETREHAVKTVETVFGDFENIDSRKFEKVKASAEMIVEEITGMDELAIHTHDLRTYDDYTYRHCVNVTAVSVAIGRLAEFSQADLRTLAAGALMHDIGKMKLSEAILNKEGKLDQDERQHVMEHPVLGFNLLSEKTQSSPIIWAIARQHHETLDGNGYPDGRTGDQIHPWAQIVCVADIWDALRSDRPYKKGWSPDKVLEHMNGSRVKYKFDPKALNILNQIVVPYPTGSKVLLSNGMIGEVQSQNNEDRSSPVIRVFWYKRGMPVDNPDKHIIDLTKESGVIIVETLSPDEM
ncbi:MAG: HD-GYP domain-containing protein [Candidatus Electryonea clarkiae]|nr:HD-GYP domain-containing protein [Candidatus Electryonea clarkiae]MDP8285631.1 HD-GYP domain-containing protein [Candidatus Electryonea clarkiae]